VPEFRSPIIPVHRYRNAPAAIDWLCKVFGFERHLVIEGENGTIAHAELSLGNGILMLGTGKDDEVGRSFKSPQDLGGMETCMLYLVVSDPDEVFARAVAANATVVRPPQNTPHGSRDFVVKDPEGHTWGVGTHDPWKKRD
jgi:uncharacterized glyoxalase superfamily protein PhnB